MEEHEILAELGEVMDSLANLPPDAFAEGFALRERQAELRSLLTDAQDAAGRDASVWADQAARKKSDDLKPFIEIHLPDSSGTGVG